jgi:copper chaperone CopZ
VASVTEELETLGGVNNVVVELNNGGISTATITSEKDLSSSQISAAVAEAGYLVVASEA